MEAVNKIIGLLESNNIDNIKLAIQLAEPYLYLNNQELLDKLHFFFGLNNHYIIHLFETTWWRKLELTKEEFHLNLYKLNLNEIPKELFEFTKVSILHLGHNNLTSIPEDISKMTSLKKIFLYNNKLTSLPNSIGKLKNLEYLFLPCNKLTKISEEIGQLLNLKHLNLIHNKLTELPSEIENLENLIHIDFTYNSFSLSEKEKIQSYLPYIKDVFPAWG